MTDEIALRRTPRQARSLRMVDQLLDAAAAVFEDVGYEAANTKLIAERAGVSVGGLYRFFPNKEAMLAALIDRYTRLLEDTYAGWFAPDQLRAWTLEEMVGRVVDNIIDFNGAHRGFQALFMSTAPSPEVAAAITESHRANIRSIATLLAMRYPALPAADRQTCATMCIALFKGCMGAAAPLDGLPLALVTAELKRALVAYVRAFVGEQPPG